MHTLTCITSLLQALFLPNYVPFMMVLAVNLSTGEKGAGRSLGLRLIYRGLLRQPGLLVCLEKQKQNPNYSSLLKYFTCE